MISGTKISPYKLSKNDCFIDEDCINCPFKVISKKFLDNRVSLLLEDIEGDQFNLSYEANDFVSIVSEDIFNQSRDKHDSIKSHVIYLIPSNSRIINDIKYLQPSRKFSYNQRTAELFTINEAKSVLINLNKRNKEGIYKYGIR